MRLDEKLRDSQAKARAALALSQDLLELLEYSLAIFLGIPRPYPQRSG